MFTNKTKTFMQSVISNDLKSFHDMHKVEKETTNPSKEDFKAGNILYKIPIKKTHMNDLIAKYKNPVKDISICDMQKQRNYLFDSVTDQIINIDSNTDFKECMETIMIYKRLLNENLYGVVLREVKNPSIIVNPFHVLTALSIMENEKFMKRKFNIIIYVHRDREYADQVMRTEYSNSDLVESNLNALLISYTDRLQIETRSISKPVKDDDEYVTISTQNKKYKDEDKDYNHYIVAHQIMTKGVLAPYYGASLIRLGIKTQSSSGLRLTPFGSCNISSDSGHKTSKQYGSVCTGEQSKYKLSGLRTLTHVNLESPYRGNFVLDGCLAYADAMIEKSIELYLSANIIAEEILPEHPYSDEEIAFTSFKDYRKWFRVDNNKASTIDIKDRYNEIKLYKQALDNPEPQDMYPSSGSIYDIPDFEIDTAKFKDPLLNTDLTSSDLSTVASSALNNEATQHTSRLWRQASLSNDTQISVDMASPDGDRAISFAQSSTPLTTAFNDSGFTLNAYDDATLPTTPIPPIEIDPNFNT